MIKVSTAAIAFCLVGAMPIAASAQSSGTHSSDFSASRANLNYHFLDERSRPYVGASLSGIYGDGVKNSSFAGLEAGLKYYVLPRTYVLGRVDYQFLFSSTSDASDAFQDSGIWAYTLGLGYHF